MRWEKIVGLSVLAGAIGASLAQQFTAPARAAVPTIRVTYQGLGAGINNNVAVVWLMGSDGGLKICTRATTGAATDAPICSAETMP